MAVAIIQARMASTRLPGKVLLPLCGHSVLAQVLGRVAAARGIERVVVATGTGAEDDAVAAEAARYGAMVYRGSPDDVLARYHGAAIQAGADTVVRVTADCPLLDPELLTEMLVRFRERSCDYLSNCQVRSYPRGLDVEIFTMGALVRSHAEATSPHQREHVTPYIYEHPAQFATEPYIGTPDRSAHRWTLDMPEDWALIQAIYARLGSGRAIFSTAAVLDLLDANPELVALNAHVVQKSTEVAR